ncbi:hypothetical protein W97_00980 [Coniosporium apollinis CBS 100218]|uniref:SCP domain-containing protein n=1 Tax=Coniosporium apollinis (strain CBS 100218) TaxID=1168221 RepID=R7YIZ0_CONA1|nr:uncharacterized protein W97_00980 [Coniosporium apollinis CBS 100218]EON61764.1 hypothetical protein W97_00980 [Coniosporium apollinis CBS 100218]
MRSSIFVTAALAVGAIATPVLKRDLVTEYAYVTVTQYVTAGGEAPAPTSTAAPALTVTRNRGYWTRRSRKSTTTSVAAPAPTSEQPTFVTVPTTTEAPATSEVPATSEAPVTSETPATSAAPAPTEAPAPSEAPVTSEAAAPAPTSGRPTGYADLVLRHHNVHRANHSAPALVWDENLAAIAREIGSSCKYEHNTKAGGGGYGQNIAAGVRENNVTAVITELFYNGEVNFYEGQYGKADPDMGNFHGWGHFSQIVWKETTAVGCHTFDCSAREGKLANVGANVAPFFTVCNYKKPGNWGGQYGKNVGASLNHPTVRWNY